MPDPYAADGKSSLSTSVGAPPSALADPDPVRAQDDAPAVDLDAPVKEWEGWLQTLQRTSFPNCHPLRHRLVSGLIAIPSIVPRPMTRRYQSRRWWIEVARLSFGDGTIPHCRSTVGAARLARIGGLIA